MHARGGQADENVAGCDVQARQDMLALDRADREAGQIVVLAPVEARHLGRLAADEREPASRQPLAMPAMTVRAVATSSRPVAK